MTSQSKIESASEANPQASPSQVEDVKKEQVEMLAKQESSTNPRTANSRRAGPSKLEIMEELSRQRFPWDE
jgi:hypothetical protein